LKISVLDSNLVRKKVIEDSINIFPISSFYCKADTVFLTKDEPTRIGYPHNEYYFTGNFKIQKRKYLIEKSDWPVNSWPLYEDSIYDVYANYLGSGGFLAFFYNKQIKKTFCTWSSGPRQVLKHNDNFYIAEEGNYKISPAFRIIHDPRKLINVANDKVAGLIRYFQHLAPSPGVYYEKLADSIKKSSLHAYGSAQNIYSVPIYTFVKDNNLFTIIKTDSLIYLAAHKDDSLIKIQPIVDTSIEMQHISFSKLNKGDFVTFQANGARMINSKMQSYSNSGFILINDSTISFNFYYSNKSYDP
jgi:hypothetical protein